MNQDYEPKVESAADLEVASIPELRWTVNDLLPQGMGILAGRPKQGKSWIALQLSLAVAGGGDFIGHSVERGDVLYLALEDSRKRVQERIRTVHGKGAPSALGVSTDWRPWNEGGEEDLDSWLFKHARARLVIIDTWARIGPQMRNRSDTYSEAYHILSRLHALSRHYSVTVLLVTHTRKMAVDGASPLDTVMGSSAITGVADTVLVLSRKQHQAIAVLHMTGRDISTRDVKLAWTGTGWTAHVDPLIVALEQIAKQCGYWEGTATDLLAVMGQRGVSPASLGKRLAILKSELQELGIRIEVEREGYKRTIRVTHMTSHTPLSEQEEVPLTQGDESA